MSDTPEETTEEGKPEEGKPETPAEEEGESVDATVEPDPIGVTTTTEGEEG